ncbi:MAG: hypothetical protein KBT04_01585 [Bacteroidales bacterium]|nr:hypothetical protein [Candidatus Colimorpha onthohippi]
MSLVAGVILCALLCGCGREAAVRRVAQGYLDAVSNYKISEAKPYVTPEMCEHTLYMDSILVSLMTDSAISAAIPAKVVIEKVVFDNDTVATVHFHKTSPNSDDHATLPMLCRDGKWWVHQIVNFPPILEALVKGTQGGQDAHTNDTVQCR